MFILADLEWTPLGQGTDYPTQVGLIRVNDRWERTASFFARIRPVGRITRWSHVGLTGGTPQDFMEAGSLQEVSAQLRSWIRPEDVLCWWTDDSEKMFKYFFTAFLYQKSVVLDYFFPEHFGGNEFFFLSAYKLAAYLMDRVPYGEDDQLALPNPPHHAGNDVEAMRLALALSQFPQSRLTRPAQISKPPKSENRPSAKFKSRACHLSDTPQGEYVYDPKTNTIHNVRCKLLEGAQDLIPVTSFAKAIVKRPKACSCCSKEYYSAVARRNKDIIDRTQFTFIYTSGSKIFHKHTCKSMLYAQTILGRASYERCINLGLRPCKLCNPTAADPRRALPKVTPPAPTKKKKTPSLPHEKDYAVKRFKQARDERYGAASKREMTESERQDFYTLTQPGYSFWAGRGYSNFHTRQCPKLKGLHDLVGFSRFNDATRAGYTPCKLCKPTKKLDAIYSIPITNKVRKDESPQVLIDHCKEQGYPYELDENGTYFSLETPVGKWRINLSANPITLEHINLVSPKGSKEHYHTQPRLFLSLSDTFSYIHRHDSGIMDKANAAPSELQPSFVGST